MKPISPKHSRSGFTQSELIVILITVFAIAIFCLGLILPSFSGSQKAPRIRCVSNLKQVGLSFRMWSGDHGEQFPMAVSTNKQGSLEFIGTGNVLEHYLAISNELNSPKVLTCPCDTKRKFTSDFGKLSNKNLSYFVGLDAKETCPEMILSGDRNVSTNGRLMSGVLTFSNDAPVAWTKDIHVNCGNIGLADGSAQQATGPILENQILKSSIVPTRLEIP